MSSAEEVTNTQEIPTPNSSDWYTPQEVANIFRVDPKTVVRWFKAGKFNEYSVQVVMTPGGHRRYRKEDIDRLFYVLNPSAKPKDQE